MAGRLSARTGDGKLDMDQRGGSADWLGSFSGQHAAAIASSN
jgi:hypothetical protein